MTKKEKSLSWEDFQALGRVGNDSQFEDELEKEPIDYSAFSVRIHLEKKHRGGKTASIIRGLDLEDDELKELTKKLKQSCGVGGSCKNGEIIIQGNNREKMMAILKDLGIKDVKLSGG